MFFYLAAIVITLLIFASSLDDFFVDLLYLFFGRKGRKSPRKIRMENLATPEKKIAVVIACWHEAKVIKQMLCATIERLRYSKFMIFVGVYPNDPHTESAVDEAIRAYLGKIVKVMNDSFGPTSKAQNLNCVWRFLKERYDGVFDIVVFHDAEDLVHPDSLRVFNGLIPSHYDMVQLPVFPIQPRLRLSGLKKFFSWLVTGTYADEFVENHLHCMSVRGGVGAFIPSAGVGTGFSWSALNSLVKEEWGGPFNPDSHTEDYELSRRAGMAGLRTGYALVKNEQGSFIATQALFPSKLKAAVKQKARWIFGIAMQQFNSCWKKNSLMQQYFLWRDKKIKYTSFLNIAGYVVSLFLVYALLTGSLPQDGALKQIFSWLLLANGVLMIERQVMRFLAVSRRYGLSEAAAAILIPPLFPARYLIGNLINFAATVRAWRMYFLWRKKGGLPWLKTDHDVYPTGILRNILVVVSVTLCLLSHSQAEGWHWSGFGNEPDEASWVLRGASEHLASFFRINKKSSFGLTLGEEHAFGSDPERPWTREIKLFTGPTARSAFVFRRADAVLSGGVNLMVGFRPNQHDLVISPYTSCGVRWRFDKGGRFPGYAWGIIRGRSLYEKGLLASGSFEQGYNLFSLRKLVGCLYTGSWFIYGDKPEYWWNRKARIIIGSRVSYSFGRGILQTGMEGYHQWGKLGEMNALRIYVELSVGWN